jgi:hypothetical protein
MNKTKAVETLKKEVIAEVIKEAKQETVKNSSKKESSSIVAKKETKTTVIKKEVKETTKPKLKVIMAKIDAKVKNPVKNLQLKNLVKIDAMTEDQKSLDIYSNTAFYVSKDIYLDQLNMMDNRLIYNKVNLASYSDNDIIGIKARKIGILNWEKNKLLLELKDLQNG